MDFTAALRDALPSLAAPPNTTSDGGDPGPDAQFLPKMMASLMSFLSINQPNSLLRTFMLFNQAVASRLGLDLTAIITVIGVLWAANRLWREVCLALQGLAMDYLMASVYISSEDEIYGHLDGWLACQPRITNSRSLMVESVSKAAQDDEEGEKEMNLSLGGSADGSGMTYLNFSRQDTSLSPRYVPSIGRHGFWFRGRYFTLQRRRETIYNEDAGSDDHQPLIRDKEVMVVSTIAWTPEPIKRLLQHTREQYYHQHFARTVIKRPNPSHLRWPHHSSPWAQVATRPVRPMSTVILDPKQKLELLADINEYLHPATSRWYANRGIPLRRGYLFHGPPGTGKTSLSFALAGVFGLDIFVVSLMEPKLKEEDLSVLFRELPRRCIVLLEDIDSAGLLRAEDQEGPDDGRWSGHRHQRKQEQEGERGEATDQKLGDEKSTAPTAVELKNDADISKPASSSVPKTDPGALMISDLARALRNTRRRDDDNGISLSGLLNVIDGVASHEGRVLIMTTNRPEALDEALIRPGRVDVQVAFANATQAQAAEIFQRMYETEAGDRQSPRRQAPSSSATMTDNAGFGGTHPADVGPYSPAVLSPPPLQGEHERRTDGGAASAAFSPHGTVHLEKMPRGDDGRPCSDIANGDAAGVAGVGAETAQIDDDDAALDPRELARIAARFGSKIPDGRFSPAELQGFLLKRKKDPRRALAEVDRWVEAAVEQKLARSRVTTVQ